MGINWRFCTIYKYIKYTIETSPHSQQTDVQILEAKVTSVKRKKRVEMECGKYDEIK